MSKVRFEVCTGRWGCFFYDNATESALTLQETADILNAADRFRTAINLPLLKDEIAKKIADK